MLVNDAGMLLGAHPVVLISSLLWLSVTRTISLLFYPTVLGISVLYPVVLDINSPLTLT